MTPEQLKASILQYAIQGKLVDQRTEEGTAEELYNKIQNEKNALIKEKRIKKEKPQPDVSEEDIPFDIPENWKWVRVGELGSWASGATPSRTNPQFYGGNIPWLKTGDLNDGYIEEVPEYITDLALEKTSVRLNPEGSVLMAMYGATIGKLGILNKPMTTNQACCACIPFTGVFNKYLFYFLMSQRGSYIGMAEGGAQPNISKEKIVSSVIPLPPLEEQNRIVAKIEELLPYVDRYAEAYEKLEQFNAKFPEDMKKSILQYAIQGKLVEQRLEEGTAEELYQQIQDEKRKLIKEGEVYREKNINDVDDTDDLPEIPETWRWCRLGELTKLITKGSSPKWQGVNYTDKEHGILFVTSENVGNEKMLLDNEKYVESKFNEMHPASILQKGDLLTNIVGASIGRTVVYDLDVNNANINQAVCIIRLVNTELKDYVLRFLKSPYAVKHLIGDVSNGGRPNLSLTAVTNLMIALPPLNEQKRIVAELEKLFPYCDKLVGMV